MLSVTQCSRQALFSLASARLGLAAALPRANCRSARLQRKAEESAYQYNQRQHAEQVRTSGAIATVRMISAIRNYMPASNIPRPAAGAYLAEYGSRVVALNGMTPLLQWNTARSAQ